MPIGEIGAFLLFLVIVFNGQWRDCPWPAQRKIGFTL